MGEALASGRTMEAVLRERVERLACGFSVVDNYFALQAFGRGYSHDGDGPLPPCLECRHFESARARVDCVPIERPFWGYFQQAVYRRAF